MQRLLLPFLFLLAAALLTSYIYYSNTAAQHVVDETEVPPAPPTAPVEELAPEGAYSSCVEKTEGDGCAFTVNNVDYDGVCQNIYDTLTCGPTFPDGTY